MAALLPPSSRSERPRRAAIRGASSLPIWVDPVAETSGTRGSSASCTARSAPPITSSASPSGTPPKPLGRALEQRRARERRQRRPLRRLPDHGVAADERERGVPAPDGDREVEGADHGDRPERMPRLREPVARALRRDRASVELPREADGEVADVDHLLHLAEPLLRDLPDLERDERAERVLLAAQLLAEQPHELAAVRARHVAPDRKGVRGAGDRRVGCGGIRAGDARDLLARDRRADDEVAALDLRPLDAEPVEQRSCACARHRLRFVRCSGSGDRPRSPSRSSAGSSRRGRRCPARARRRARVATTRARRGTGTRRCPRRTSAPSRR